MPAVEATLLQGTLDLVILKALALGPRHGYAIARWIAECTDDAVGLEDRALYVALHRLESRDFIAAEWGVTENNRRARYYAITPAGRRALRAKTSSWMNYVDAISKILKASERRSPA